MSYTALHRKWCLVSFENVKGQDPIVQILKNQITPERIGHMYLFCGIRGAGKASTAKIFAKAVNCEYPVNDNPCNECPICRSIQSGSSMNVVGIDAASNNDVENIRDIREQVQYSPIEGRYRVYITDEVHVLSIGTFNALLGTPEESPPCAIFILTTTEACEIPTTILPCCQRHDLKRISLKTIADRLRELTQAEQIQVKDKALLYVAKAVDGSFGNALGLLDQYVVFRYRRVLIHDSALEILGVVDPSVLSQMFGATVEGRTRGRICSLEEIATQGREPDQLITDFIWYMRNLLLIRSTDDAESLVGMSKENLKQLRSDVGKADRTTLTRYIRIFSELFNQLRYVSQKRVPAEVAFIKLTRLSMEPNPDAILRRLGDLGARMEDLEAGRMAIPVTAAYHVAGSPPAGQVLQAGVGLGQDGGTAPQTAAPYASGLQVEPGIMSEKMVPPRAQLEDLRLVRNEWAKVARSMGSGARSYLWDTVVEPDGEGCLAIAPVDLMNHDMGKRPTVIGELGCYVEANFSRSIYFKTGLVGRGECLNTIYAIQEELEEKIHMDITHEDE